MAEVIVGSYRLELFLNPGFKGRIVDFDVHGFNLLDRADQIERSYRS